jgi:carboxymethylenebutenolidase
MEVGAAMVKQALSNVAALMILVVFFCTDDAIAQDWAKERLEKSPRHLEWVDVKQGDRTLKCFIAYPEAKKSTSSVLVIHEIFGLSDWVRELCDELSAEGFIAIAPDLLSGKPGEETAKYKSVDDVRKAVSSLPHEQVANDLQAVAAYVAKLPAANGKVAVAGFCWGGAQTWLAMTTNPSLKAGCVFYGIADSSLALDKINAPVYGFYGEKDARVASTVDGTIQRMKTASKKFEPEIYANAGYGFMRTGEAPDADAPNALARKKAWSRLLEITQHL